MKEILSKRERELPEAEMAEIIKLAEESKGLLSLGSGEPDFTPPKHVIEFAKKRLDEGYTHYSPPSGRIDLKRAIQKKLKRENRIKADIDEIVVTCGSTEAILLSLMSLIDVGEHVMIPDPGFLSYRPTIELLNAYPLSIRLKEEEGFQLTRETLDESIQDPKKTRLIIVNSPSNPTGVVYPKKTLEEVADFAVEHDILILSDEAYEKYVYGKAKHVSIGSFNGMEDRVVTLQSFSKTYAMPGFRVGYAVGREKLVAAIRKIHIYSSICAPTISQEAALAALTGPQDSIKMMQKEYDRRRKLIIKRLREIGFKCAEPEGAFYAFPNIRKFKKSSMAFTKHLLKNGVVVVPGTEFGRYGEGFIRLSYATAYEKIEKAMDRLEAAIKKL